ncbi:sensor histidine kinase inhibitor, KipI family [Quadrisphaera granulorum]|uniref:KipI family sensor histidine kinase inhibitor n=1 Tax=Quadrisphaera granulorum TaxID=317664 RepID=A0A316A4Y2_9ACTN|nr:5-oxoprolinase/urea amidolyase family protein [Quadrisphaera granulorum]PWJ52961.1 KipI family sensor histidine kinase inhibitor [Quadrisphaera granulorum]SZE97343.1 sensor histidine kinase inhibitor, KipI family [Quadrisphaera granulorum]
MRVLPVGSSAVLLELDDLTQVLALRVALRERPLPGVVEVVPAARTLLLRWETGRVPDLSGIPWDPSPEASRELSPEHDALGSETVEVPVVYDGDDLADVTRLTGLTSAEVVRRHAATPWSVAFTGFAPGFAYLVGGDPTLRVPRREVPRTRVPAGAVGLAGEFSGVYPRASPGGWQLIGRTDLAMWDGDRDPPALLRPGVRVRFTPTTLRDHGQSATRASPRDAASRTGEELRLGGLEVLDPGPLTLVTDLGRPGHADVGVSPSGALDRRALRAANRAVGGAAGAPALEVAGPLEVRGLGRSVVAVTGAAVVVLINGHPMALGTPIPLDDGDVLTLTAPRAGAAAYVAVRGGIAAPVPARPLGSAATDVLSGLGPGPLRRGDVLAVDGPPWLESSVALLPEETSSASLPRVGAVTELDVVLGPRDDWFTPASRELLCRQEWQVSAQSNRVGARLEGARPLERTEPGRELPSEPTVRGAVQVPPSGQPVLFGPDHPVTGGYPVVACVAAHHLDLAGQLIPGALVRFRAVPASGRRD